MQAALSSRAVTACKESSSMRASFSQSLQTRVGRRFASLATKALRYSSTALAGAVLLSDDAQAERKKVLRIIVRTVRENVRTETSGGMSPSGDYIRSNLIAQARTFSVPRVFTRICDYLMTLSTTAIREC